MLMHPAEYLDNPTLSEHARSAYHKAKPHVQAAYEKGKPYVKRAAKATARGALRGGAYGASALSRGLSHAASGLTRASQSARLRNPTADESLSEAIDEVIHHGYTVSFVYFSDDDIGYQRPPLLPHVVFAVIQSTRSRQLVAKGVGSTVQQAFRSAAQKLGLE